MTIRQRVLGFPWEHSLLSFFSPPCLLYSLHHWIHCRLTHMKVKNPSILMYTRLPLEMHAEHELTRRIIHLQMNHLSDLLVGCSCDWWCLLGRDRYRGEHENKYTNHCVMDGMNRNLSTSLSMHWGGMVFPSCFWLQMTIPKWTPSLVPKHPPPDILSTPEVLQDALKDAMLDFEETYERSQQSSRENSLNRSKAVPPSLDLLSSTRPQTGWHFNCFYINSKTCKSIC